MHVVTRQVRGYGRMHCDWQEECQTMYDAKLICEMCLRKGNRYCLISLDTGWSETDGWKQRSVRQQNKHRWFNGAENGLAATNQLNNQNVEKHTLK